MPKQGCALEVTEMMWLKSPSDQSVSILSDVGEASLGWSTQSSPGLFLCCSTFRTLCFFGGGWRVGVFFYLHYKCDTQS